MGAGLGREFIAKTGGPGVVFRRVYGVNGGIPVPGFVGGQAGKISKFFLKKKFWNFFLV